MVDNDIVFILWGGLVSLPGYLSLLLIFCLTVHGITIYFVVLCRRVGKPPRIFF